LRGNKALFVKVGTELRTTMTFGCGEYAPKRVTISRRNGEIQVPNVDLYAPRRRNGISPEIHHVHFR
jgi:hypothetical protein